MAVFDRQIKTVKRIIDKYGESVTLKSTAFTTPDSSKPWEVTQSSSTDSTIKMLFLSPSNAGDTLFGRELLQYLKATEVSTGMVRGYVEGAVNLKIADLVVRASATLKIKAIDTLSPNGQKIMHVLEFEL